MVLCSKFVCFGNARRSLLHYRLSTCAKLHGFAGEEEGLDDDEALARRLQEQEDALATRGRATRGALRVTLKPKLAAQKGPIRGSESRAVRSSSRLKPQAAESKEGPTTRGTGSAGVHETHMDNVTTDCLGSCYLVQSRGFAHLAALGLF